MENACEINPIGAIAAATAFPPPPEVERRSKSARRKSVDSTRARAVTRSWRFPVGAATPATTSAWSPPPSDPELEAFSVIRPGSAIAVWDAWVASLAGVFSASTVCAAASGCVSFTLRCLADSPEERTDSSIVSPKTCRLANLDSPSKPLNRDGVCVAANRPGRPGLAAPKPPMKFRRPRAGVALGEMAVASITGEKPSTLVAKPRNPRNQPVFARQQ